MNQAKKAPNPQQVAPTMIYGRPVPSFYVEGVSQIVVGAPNSRLILHSFVEKSQTPAGSNEVRHIACELIMPTAVILEIAQNLINQIAQNKDAIRSNIRQLAEKSDNLFAAVETIDLLKSFALAPEKSGDSK